ncbi:hypothetical protein BH18ACI5_BH18ACI5_22370 [soil metagenome]
MATYNFAVAFEADTTTDPQTDGVHYDAQYGFGVDSGNGVQTLGPGSGQTGEHFETVHVPGGSGTPNQFAVTLFSNLIGIDTTRSFLRCAFRPAHDVAPGNNLPLSPLNNSGTQSLLGGVLLNAATSAPVNVPGTNYGLPGSGTYSTQCKFAGTNLASGPRGRSVHFELTIEISIVGSDGTWSYYKVDPEMIIDF